MTKPDKKTLLEQQARISNLLLKAEGFEHFLNSERAQEVVIYPPTDMPFGDRGTMFSKPRPDIHVGGRPITHHHFELRELIKELRLELDTVNKQSNITVAEARRQLLRDLQEMPCPKSTSTEAKSQ
jgi:hypothetical protein